MTEGAQDEAAERAARRRSWPVRKLRLGEEPGDDLSATTTATERVEMVWPLTVEAWALAGRPIPDYPRSETPIRVVPSPLSRRRGGKGGAS